MLHLRNDLVVLTVGKIGDEETLNLYSGSRHPFYLSRLILSALARLPNTMFNRRSGKSYAQKKDKSGQRLKKPMQVN